MVTPAVFFEALNATGVRFFAGVPDSLLKDICGYIDDHVPAERHVITVNEGAAIALASGYQIATGEVPLVYMQNSGLGNAVNPLTSLADAAVYHVPMLLIIGWRGEPGVADEPQHVTMGAVTPAVLDAIRVPYRILADNDEGAERDVKEAIAHVRERGAPYALLVKKGTFAKYGASVSTREQYSLTRERALERVLTALESNAVIVSTTGKLSRELFELRERRGEGHARDFLTVGSMGHASQIALGVALAQPTRPVYCLDGDGAALMHLGGLATIGARAPKNFRHVLFNNGMHESVGGQGTTGFVTDFCAAALACKYPYADMVSEEESLRGALFNIQKKSELSFLEIRIAGGSREDLGRPTRTPEENKSDFQKFLKE